jgi:uncharacterized protein (DUF849 family)
MSKIIITAAVTGAVHVPSLSPYLPITAQQIIDDAMAAYRAGAAVAHIHSRNPQTGQPSVDLQVYRAVLAGIRRQCDMAVCITTGGTFGMPLQEKVAAVSAFRPELATCNAGSLNFYLGPLAASPKMRNPKHDWEAPYLEMTEDAIFSNTFKAIRYYMQTMHTCGTVPEFEIYEVGMINNLAYLKEQGEIRGPIYLQFVLGITGGIPATVDNLAYLRHTADRQLGKGNYIWSCAAAGRQQFPIVTAALAMRGNARVGLEDNLYLRPGVLAKNSGEQVALIRAIGENMGREIATPNEARQILGLKGLDKAAF